MVVISTGVVRISVLEITGGVVCMPVVVTRGVVVERGGVVVERGGVVVERGGCVVVMRSVVDSAVCGGSTGVVNSLCSETSMGSVGAEGSVCSEDGSVGSVCSGGSVFSPLSLFSAVVPVTSVAVPVVVVTFDFTVVTVVIAPCEPISSVESVTVVADVTTGVDSSGLMGGSDL